MVDLGRQLKFLCSQGLFLYAAPHLLCELRKAWSSWFLFQAPPGRQQKHVILFQALCELSNSQGLWNASDTILNMIQSVTQFYSVVCVNQYSNSFPLDRLLFSRASELIPVFFHLPKLLLQSNYESRRLKTSVFCTRKMREQETHSQSPFSHIPRMSPCEDLLKYSHRLLSEVLPSSSINLLGFPKPGVLPLWLVGPSLCNKKASETQA